MKVNPLINEHGYFHSDAPAVTGLAQVIERDESGLITAIQGGSLTLDASRPLIKALHEQNLFIKSQQAAKQQKLMLKAQQQKSRPMRKSFAIDGFEQLANELEAMRDRLIK